MAEVAARPPPALPSTSGSRASPVCTCIPRTSRKKCTVWKRFPTLNTKCRARRVDMIPTTKTESYSDREPLRPQTRKNRRVTSLARARTQRCYGRAWRGKDGGAGEGHVVFPDTVAASGPDSGPRIPALGPGVATQPSESAVSLRTGGGTEARSCQAAPQGP